MSKEVARVGGRFAPTNQLENYEPVTESGCWIWGGALSTWGYGKATLMVDGRKRYVGAHRMFYEGYVGPIPDGMCICHKCDTPACVNPDHLMVGSHAENSRQKVVRRRSAFGERNARRKLTDAQALEIYLSDEHHTVLEERYGVCYHTVRGIKSGKHWGQVTGHRSGDYSYTELMDRLKAGEGVPA